MINGRTQLRQLQSGEQDTELVKNYIKSKAADNEPLQILEAGCGQRWNIDLGDTHYLLTGVDLDPAALEMRRDVQGDLDVAIVGDLCWVELDKNKFDVIYSAFVLEHIEQADHALGNFAEWLRPGGIIVLRVPDPQSVRGFFTRITPHWFHVAYYKYALKYSDAGKPGHPPYVTYYHPVVSRKGMRRFCGSTGFLIREEFGDGGDHWLGGRGVAAVSQLFMRLVAALSFGRLTAEHTNLLYILEKKTA